MMTLYARSASQHIRRVGVRNQSCFRYSNTHICTTTGISSAKPRLVFPSWQFRRPASLHTAAIHRASSIGRSWQQRQLFLAQFQRRLLSLNSNEKTTNAGGRWVLKPNSDKTKNTGNQPGTRWKQIARVIKMLRIPVIIVSVYEIGYQQGIIECSKYPLLMQDRLLKSVLADCGVRHRDQVTIFTSDDVVTLPMSPTAALQSKVVRIGNNIIKAASIFVREELEKAVEKAKQELPPDTTIPLQEHLLLENKEVAFWRDALIRIEGETKHMPWHYLIVKTDLPNAFVTEILPQRFFITTAMFEHIVENEDELATILGHEMSHLILGHVSQRNYMETMLRTLEVLLLAMDPTEGILSLGVIGGLASLRAVLIASFSREHENEADELGLRLAAMACYNTERGAYVMAKMHDHQVALAGEPRSNTHLLSLLDTHPPSKDRYQRILEMSKTENPEKYSHSTCASVQRRMLQAIWGSPSLP